MLHWCPTHLNRFLSSFNCSSGTGCVACFAEPERVVTHLAGSFGPRLSPRTCRKRAGGCSACLATNRGRYQRCVAARDVPSGRPTNYSEDHRLLPETCSLQAGRKPIHRHHRLRSPSAIWRMKPFECKDSEAAVRMNFPLCNPCRA